MIEQGQQAPDFELPDQEGRAVKLSDLRGRQVVVYFYPKADPGLHDSGVRVRDRRADYERADAVVLGISPDPVAKVKKFHDKEGLNFALLADEGHRVADAYGVWVEKSMYGKTYFGNERTTFVIDPTGRSPRSCARSSPPSTTSWCSRRFEAWSLPAGGLRRLGLVPTLAQPFAHGLTSVASTAIFSGPARIAHALPTIGSASVAQSFDSFVEAAGQFFSDLAAVHWGALVLGLLFFGLNLTLRSRAFFHSLRAAYPAVQLPVAAHLGRLLRGGRLQQRRARARRRHHQAVPHAQLDSRLHLSDGRRGVLRGVDLRRRASACSC